MNDIEILEEILNRQIEDTEGTKIMKQAIENLINRVKELEEELKEIKKEYSDEQKHEMKNTIPKSKIKEKIEEKINYYKSYKGLEIYKKDNFKEIVITLEQLKQELLEEQGISSRSKADEMFKKLNYEKFDNHPPEEKIEQNKR